ncbi:hypothetical protein HanXRQr2_Chr05g0225791 [Helianthus annuus]|uniref:Uncharacterized protein n=1 Tax=Helianthus annuus TaxID=4232 RepID=A0A251UVH6_HELAN|nr:hypothetical protein HanXRQr2_Chr05g0225791 [Helianthus annuus]
MHGPVFPSSCIMIEPTCILWPKIKSDAPCGKPYNTRTRHSGRLGCAVSRIHLIYSISKDIFHPTLSSHHCNPEPNRPPVWHVCTS